LSCHKRTIKNPPPAWLAVGMYADI
jgi:hypothetical protein